MLAVSLFLFDFVLCFWLTFCLSFAYPSLTILTSNICFVNSYFTFFSEKEELAQNEPILLFLFT